MRASAWLLVVNLCTLLASAHARAAGKAVDGAVNLNTAPPDVLALLPGIGPAKAQSIVAYRKRHPFRTVDELVRIKGVGHKMVRHLRAHLAVSGPTTAAPVAPGFAPAPGAAPVPSPPAPSKRPALVVCARPIIHPSRPSAAPFPTHGACARPP